MQWLLYFILLWINTMTDIAKKIKNTFQNSEAKMKTGQAQKY
jgi:hypothetical protein